MARKQVAEAGAEAPSEAEVKPGKVRKHRKKVAPVEAAEELVPQAPPAPTPAAETWPQAGEDWVEDVERAYLESKYTLVSVAAKRARQILNGSKRRVESLSEKPVTLALEELSQGKLYFERTRDGVK